MNVSATAMCHEALPAGLVGSQSIKGRAKSGRHRRPSAISTARFPPCETTSEDCHKFVGARIDVWRMRRFNLLDIDRADFRCSLRETEC